MLYAIRDIVNMDKEAVWQLPDGPMSIQFDDGVLETTARATIFSWYCMVFHRLYPEIAHLKEHHLGKRRAGTRTHLDLMGEGFFTAVDLYSDRGQFIDTEAMSEVVFRTTNEIYNDFTYRLEAYITTVSILDFVEVVEEPRIKKANDEVVPSQTSIDHTYGTIKSVLLEAGSLPHNAVAEAAKSGLVSMGQILQCVGPRGYLTDIDSNIFRNPILQGYVHGIRTLHDSMIESRSASKALFFAKDPVADSEYFNRKMQLHAATMRRMHVHDAPTMQNATSSVQHLHFGDCGSRQGIPFKVRSSDLESLVGKFYITEHGVRPIRQGDRSLIGQTLLLRSPLKCEHTDPYGVCATCFGELAWSIPANTNLGHVAATVICEIISQNVLSTKHLDGSSTVDVMQLGAFEEGYIRLGADPNVLMLSTDLADARVRLIVAADEAKRLGDIDIAKNIRELSITKITELREVEMIIERKGEPIEHVVIPVSMGSRYSSFTHEFLSHLKKTSWTLTNRGDYQMDLADWDHDLPLFEMPMKHTNMVEFMKSIEVYIRAAKKSKQNKHQKSLRDYKTPEDGLLGLYTLVSSKLKVNLAYLEIIVLANKVRSVSDLDHRPPVPKWSGELAGYEDNMVMRSLSAAMAYEKQGQVLYDLRSYIVSNRSDHPLDTILMGAINQQ